MPRIPRELKFFKEPEYHYPLFDKVFWLSQKKVYIPLSCFYILNSQRKKITFRDFEIILGINNKSDYYLGKCRNFTRLVTGLGVVKDTNSKDKDISDITNLIQSLRLKQVGFTDYTLIERQGIWSDTYGNLVSDKGIEFFLLQFNEELDTFKKNIETLTDKLLDSFSDYGIYIHIQDSFNVRTFGTKEYIQVLHSSGARTIGTKEYIKNLRS